MVGCVNLVVRLPQVDRIYYNEVFAVFDNTWYDPDWNSRDYVREVAGGLVNGELIGETKVSTAETQLQPYAGQLSEELGVRQRARRKGRVLSGEFVADTDAYEEA